ncbi:hypothetical protein GCM10020295_20350 [Streptomyces cinereospinus]
MPMIRPVLPMSLMSCEPGSDVARMTQRGGRKQGSCRMYETVPVPAHGDSDGSSDGLRA